MEKNNRRVLLLLQIPSHGIRANKIGEAPPLPPPPPFFLTYTWSHALHDSQEHPRHGASLTLTNANAAGTGTGRHRFICNDNSAAFFLRHAVRRRKIHTGRPRAGTRRVIILPRLARNPVSCGTVRGRGSLQKRPFGPFLDHFGPFFTILGPRLNSPGV